MGITDFSFFTILSIVGWVVVGIRIMRLCDASGVSNGWLAFVPLLNYTRWARLAGKSPWLVLLWIIPPVGIILSLFWLASIATATATKSPWFWAYLIATIVGWLASGVVHDTTQIIVAVVLMVVSIGAQWMIFDPTRPIGGATA